MAFLGVMVFLDTFKLIKLRSILMAIGIGCLASIICLFANRWLLDLLSIKTVIFTRYAAPVVEEFFKSLLIVYLIRARKVGFLVDSAIYGFAIGTGFALIENIYYLSAIDSANMLLWVLRGFGTAFMHGGTAAIFAIVSKSLTERRASEKVMLFLPGFAFAVVIHSIFNHFVLPAVISTVLNLVVLSILVLLVFERSERKTRDWLGVGFDADAQMLEMVISGEIADTRIGRYLEFVKTKFPGSVVADMLCYLRVYLELAMRAKGILMMKEAGIKVTADEEVNSMLSELKYLEGSIGKTGKLAIHPLLHTGSRDLWQISMLK